MDVDQVADGVHRFSDGISNCYAVTDGGAVTLIDGSWPWSVRRVLASLERLGHSGADVAAVVVTHGHPDHFGAAEPLRRDHGSRIVAHPDDEDLLRGRRVAGSPLEIAARATRHLWRPFTWRFLAHGLGHGFVRPNWVRAVDLVTDDETLDVPGRPQAVFTPGHTAGHTAYYIRDRGVVFSGDAITTLSVVSGSTGPQVGALGEDMEAAQRSLDRFDGLEADLVLPGHGDPWHGSPADAARLARGRGDP